MDRWASIQQRAADVLSNYKERTGQSPFNEQAGSHARLADIARELYGLSVIPDDELEDGLSGYLSSDEDLIGYRPSDPSTRQKFTIAHELGHRALEHKPRDFRDSSEDIDETPFAGSLTIKDGVYRAYSDRDRWELEANVFAAELLMPVERVREMVLGDPSWTVANFATYFGVSRSAMLNQLVAALLLRSTSSAPGSSNASYSLDPSQERAAKAAGATLVVAGPGSGKTRVLVERFRYLVAEQGVPANRILVLTFANKAAEELRERLSALLPSESHHINIETFHSFGLRLLQSFGHYLELGKDPQLVTDMDAFVLLRRRLGEVPLGAFADLHRPARNLPDLLSAISRAKDELVSPSELAQDVADWERDLEEQLEQASEEETEALLAERSRARLCADVPAIYATYQRWLREGGFLDYGDLIAETVRLFDLPDVAQEIRNTWDHILIDEFQDSNYASGRLVHALDDGRNIVWAVGDPRQSIYRFRGASPVNLAGFANDYEDAEIVSLEWNYRSVEDIVLAGQAVNIPLPLQSNGGAYSPHLLKASRVRITDDPGVELRIAETMNDEIHSIVSCVQEEVSSLSPGDVAILCRTRAHAQEISDALEAAHIPTDWSGALEGRATFKDVIGVLLLMADDPQGLIRLSRLSEHHLEEDDLQTLLTVARERGRSVKAALFAADAGEVEGLSVDGLICVRNLKALTGSLSHLTTPWKILAAYLFEHASWFRPLLSDDTVRGRRRLATLGQVANLAREFNTRTALVGGSDTKTFVAFLRMCLESGKLGLPDDALVAKDVVHVLTVHRSKGLQWPVVFVPHLVEKRFPLGEHDPLPLPPGLIHGSSDDDEMLEEYCLFYVAITRARDRLILSRTVKYSNGPATPAPFLGSVVSALEPSGRIKVVQVASPPSSQEPANVPSLAPWPLDFPVPFSALNEYDSCGQRYKYERGYGLRGEDRGSSQFYRSLYTTLSWMANQASAGSSPGSAAAIAHLMGHWEENGLADHWYGPAYRRFAERIIHAIAARLKSGMQISIRRRALLQVGDVERAVELTLDEEEEIDGKRIYRRYHLGPPAKSHKGKDRLALTAALHRQEHGDENPYEIRLYYPLSGLDEVVSPSKQIQSNRLKKMANFIEKIESGHFEPKPNRMQCPTCPFNLICPAKF